MNTINNDVIAVRQLHNEVLSSFNALDLEKLLSLHTDDIILMEPNMPTIQGKQEVVKFFEKFKQQKISLQLSYNINEIEVFGDRAFVRGQVIKTTVEKNKKPVTDVGKFLTLSQKQGDGTWLRTHVIVNSDMAIEEAPETSSRVSISMGIRDRLWKN